MKQVVSCLLICWSLMGIGLESSAQLNFLKKKKEEEGYVTSYQMNGKSFIGIAPVLEAYSGIVRSFAVYELLRKYPIRINGQEMEPALVTYPFVSPYAVSGTIEANRVKLKFYVNGKKTTEESGTADIAGIYTALLNGFSAQGDPDFNASKSKIDEGDPDEVEQKSIAQLLPGELKCRMPEDTIINIFKQLQPIETFKTDDPYEAAREVKGRFDPIDESDINFFKWREIPYSLKDMARKLVFPRTAGVGPALSYISAGNKLYNAGDGPAATHCYVGAIATSKDLLASPFEASAIRYVAFRELAKIYDGPKEGRKKTADLFRMISAAHLAYLNNPAAKKERVQYYSSIGELSGKLREAEGEAQSQRTMRTLSMINSGLSAASSMTSAAVGNQQAAAAFKSNAEKGFMEQMETDRRKIEALKQKYGEFDKKVVASSFRMDDGTNFDQGKPITPNEIAYLLIKTPETTKKILTEFANDKPNLRKLFATYDRTKSDADLGALFKYFSEYEMKVVNYECRGMAIPVSVLEQF